MLVRVDHTLDYLYSREVFCEPVTIRLRPRDDPFQTLRRWDCTIDPQPAGVSDFRDLDGNLIRRVWFEGLTDHLRIQSSIEVETLCSDPFQYLLASEAAVIPIRLDAIEQTLAATYSRPGTLSPRIAELANDLQRQAGKQTTRFLPALAAHLHATIAFVVRPSGDPWPAEKTLAERTGSCRDIAVLFCEVCRASGLPARFVSGYAVDPDHAGCHHLHAWCEVYLPGAGWRGFDPTLGLAVADRHVALASSRLPALAAPTSGIFRGTGVTSELQAHVNILTDS
ncbi:Protein-glutamine gamma-glutamyltransferase [Caulifigura coniformis]|uniref:Protein-glutamine gamma-glutamyltransferase n=1 Tax=Caulifigura coniformis TaxID=2527983 RepID=A0A517SGC5_9PLAN|nr:transglutaminase family protein [Caulifigura coniformis]QDT55186.1 Protein-glutamine gamma-glutamyltransferase [Caulifigura coniformis]